MVIGISEVGWRRSATAGMRLRLRRLSGFSKEISEEGRRGVTAVKLSAPFTKVGRRSWMSGLGTSGTPDLAIEVKEAG